MSHRLLTILSATVVAWGLAVPAAMAQQPAAAPTAESSQSYSDTQLEKFITASRQVASISHEYTPRLEAASDQKEREDVFREADEKMVDAVQNEGLTVEEFNGINQALQSDPALEQRVTRMLD